MHSRRKPRPQRHCARSKRGRKRSGASSRPSQRRIFGSTAGFAHGSAWPAEICPPLANEVSSPAWSRRSTTVTSWPASARYQALVTPITPAPRTRTFTAERRLSRRYDSRMPLYAIGERRVTLVGKDHFIAPDATLVGDITLQPEASVWFQVVIRAENDRVVIGEGSNVQDGSVLHVDPGYPLTLGRGVSVGHKAMLHGCSIGDGTLVGINSVVMNGAKIGKGVLIGANTLIAEGKEIPDGVLVLGSPGKVVRELSPEQKAYLPKIATGYAERGKYYNANLKRIT